MLKKFFTLSFLCGLCCVLGVASYTNSAQAMLNDDESERVESISVIQQNSLQTHVNTRDQEDRRLLEKIHLIHQGSFETYGSRRIHAALKNDGETCSRKRVAKMMKENGIEAKTSQRFNKKALSQSLSDSKVSWTSYLSSPIKRISQNTYDIVDFSIKNPKIATVIGLNLLLPVVAAVLDYRCVGVCKNGTWNWIGPCWNDYEHCVSPTVCSIVNCDGPGICGYGNCAYVYCANTCSSILSNCSKILSGCFK
jgi:hypothetical protein